uniref:Uncharacterized protein n=1 Tax=Rhizophora mucronata TaxID=61149 RepID=A0A2P2QQU5_RHIMU
MWTIYSYFPTCCFDLALQCVWGFKLIIYFFCEN